MKAVLLGDTGLNFSEDEYAFGVGDVQRIAHTLLRHMKEQVSVLSVKA
jgi:hypothetical protein